MENYIKEAKSGLTLDAITNDGFYPNEADAMLKIIAYNVYQGFKQEVAPQEAKTYTVARMRRIFSIFRQYSFHTLVNGRSGYGKAFLSKRRGWPDRLNEPSQTTGNDKMGGGGNDARFGVNKR